MHGALGTRRQRELRKPIHPHSRSAMTTASPLRSYGFLPSYRSGRDNLARELFGAALAEATTYRRAAGFFSSSIFGVLGAPLASFFDRGGRITLVTSTLFDAGDVEAIERDYIQRITQSYPTIKSLCQGLASGKRNGAGLFGAALRLGLLQIFVARPMSSIRHAIYHEKFGLFGDGRGTVAFSGSGNEFWPRPHWQFRAARGLLFMGRFQRAISRRVDGPSI